MTKSLGPNRNFSLVPKPFCVIFNWLTTDSNWDHCVVIHLVRGLVQLLQPYLFWIPSIFASVSSGSIFLVTTIRLLERYSKIHNDSRAEVVWYSHVTSVTNTTYCFSDQLHLREYRLVWHFGFYINSSARAHKALPQITWCFVADCIHEIAS